MGLVILSGASGAGKTTIVKAIAAEFPAVTCLHFDSIGVPSVEKMVALYGSPEEWQRVMMIEWIRRIQTTYLPSQTVLFEGQVRISFIKEALAESGISDATVILVDCDDDVRRSRLEVDRDQSELANEQMMNWARFLRAEAQQNEIMILDTSNRTISGSADEILNALGPEPQLEIEPT